MHKIKKYRDHLIIQVGDVYRLEGRDYEVITGTSEIIGGDVGTLVMSRLVYWLKDVETGEMKLVPESELKVELPKYNEVVSN